VIGALISWYGAETIEKELRAAANAIGVEMLFVRASSDREIAAAFADFNTRRVGGLIVGNSAFFDSRQEQLVALASRYALPTIFEWSDFVGAGGLMSYGTDRADAHRVLGRYASRILRGARPAQLPVLQSERFELAINRKTAGKLGLTIPASLLQSADKVIQ
jgi:putative ABC transport system substrate-binding protein